MSRSSPAATVCAVLLGLAAVAFTSSSPASAQVREATPEERQACEPDVMRLCSQFVPAVPQIVACLRENRANLNPQCRRVMFPSVRGRR